MPDISAANHGSIWLLRPNTPAATDWFSDVIPEDAQWFGGAVAVEPRYVDAIVEGAQAEGLTVG